MAFVCGIGDAMDTVATNTDFELCQLRSVHPFLTYHKRLAPLLAEFDGAPITPYPRNLLGFTPGQQGVCCVYCQSTKLITEGITVMPLDNPYICCLDCGQRFMLRVWRKQVKVTRKINPKEMACYFKNEFIIIDKITSQQGIEKYVI